MVRTYGRLIGSVCLLLGGGVLHAQATAAPAGATKISQQQIASTLRQKMAGVPMETGGGLFDGSDYRIGALKRGLPGEVEVHRDDTDILYILSGTATVLTGGSVVGKHAIGDKEERGTSIRDGVRHVLRAGDMLVIPKGQPHWFQKIAGQVSYIVIKVQ
jgi:mannose-6-phosphate isomerase-like protein (cupin superfamily)